MTVQCSRQKYGETFYITVSFKPEKQRYSTEMVWTFICRWIAHEMDFQTVCQRWLAGCVSLLEQM